MAKTKAPAPEKAPEKQPEKKESKEYGGKKKRRGTSDGSMAC